MLRIFLLVLTLSFSVLASAAPKMLPAQRFLDKIQLKVSAEQWITTKTALVTVSIDANLNKTALAEARKNILGKLGTIAKGEWHIVRFDRSEDPSGLERLSVSAKARVSESALTGLNVQAKKVSQPGTTYRVDSIDFTPSLVEREQGLAQVREALYTKIKAEIKRVQGVYPNQPFTVHNIRFSDVATMMQKAQPRALMATEGIGINVSNKVQLSAMVTLAFERPRAHPSAPTNG